MFFFILFLIQIFVNFQVFIAPNYSGFFSQRNGPNWWWFALALDLRTQFSFPRILKGTSEVVKNWKIEVWKSLRLGLKVASLRIFLIKFYPQIFWREKVVEVDQKWNSSILVIFLRVFLFFNESSRVNFSLSCLKMSNFEHDLAQNIPNFSKKIMYSNHSSEISSSKLRGECGMIE